MAHALTNVLVHVVFSTKNRQKDLRREIQQALRDWMTQTITEQGGATLATGFGLDHAHVLLRLPSDKALSEIVQRIKGSSSRRLKLEFPDLRGFSWQAGYSAFSVSQSKVDTVREYVQQQEERHRRMSFEQEIVSLLKRNEIEFQERRLWATSPD